METDCFFPLYQDGLKPVFSGALWCWGELKKLFGCWGRFKKHFLTSSVNIGWTKKVFLVLGRTENSFQMGGTFFGAD